MSNSNMKLITEIEDCEITLQKLKTALDQLGDVYFTYALGEQFTVKMLIYQRSKAFTLFDIAVDYMCQATEQIEKVLNMATESERENDK